MMHIFISAHDQLSHWKLVILRPSDQTTPHKQTFFVLSRPKSFCVSMTQISIMCIIMDVVRVTDDHTYNHTHVMMYMYV